MYLGVVILSMIIALIRKGKFSNIKYTKVSLWYLLVVALLAYIGLIAGTIMQIPFVLNYQFWIYFAVYLFVLLPVVFNFSSAGYVILIIGVALNFMVTFLNGGKMPVLQSAVDMGGSALDSFMQFFSATNVLATITEPYLTPLCRIAAIPLGVTAIPVSIGDIIISVGLFFIIQKFMVVKETKKAPEKERLAYTGQLNFTSELNIDEIVKAAEGGEVPSEGGLAMSDIEIATSSRGALDEFIVGAEDDVILGGGAPLIAQAPTQMEATYGMINSSVNDAPPISGVAAGDLVIGDTAGDDEDEFDSILRALDNVNNKQPEGALTMAQVLEAQPQPSSAQEEDIDVVLKSVEEIVEEDTIEQAAEDVSIEYAAPQVDEEIQTLMQDIISDDEAEEVSEEVGEDQFDAEFPSFDDGETAEERDETDAMLRYMMSVFDNKDEVEPIFDEEEDDSYEARLLKNMLADPQAHRLAEEVDSGPIEIHPAPEDDDIYEIEKVFDIIKEESLSEEKPIEAMTDEEIDVVLTQIRSFEPEPQQPQELSIGAAGIEEAMGPEEDVDTANPFIIQNGRIVENPNYKFKKTLDIEEQRRQDEAREEAVIAFDSTQNLEFIRKEIFAEMKRQEKEAGISSAPAEERMMQETNVIPTITEDMLEDAAQSIEKLDGEAETQQTPAAVKTPEAGHEEYERVEFEIDGKMMYVWIKK